MRTYATIIRVKGEPSYKTFIYPKGGLGLDSKDLYDDKYFFAETDLSSQAKTLVRESKLALRLTWFKRTQNQNRPEWAATSEWIGVLA